MASSRPPLEKWGKKLSDDFGSKKTLGWFAPLSIAGQPNSVKTTGFGGPEAPDLTAHVAVMVPDEAHRRHTGRASAPAKTAVAETAAVSVASAERVGVTTTRRRRSAKAMSAHAALGRAAIAAGEDEFGLGAGDIGVGPGIEVRIERKDEIIDAWPRHAAPELIPDRMDKLCKSRIVLNLPRKGLDLRVLQTEPEEQIDSPRTAYTLGMHRI